MNRFLTLIVTLTACQGANSLVSTTATTDATSAALTQTQCTYQSFSSDVSACFEAFKTCTANAEEATLADCKAQLHDCLPPPPADASASASMDGGCGPGGNRNGGHQGPPPPENDADGGTPLAPPVPDSAVVLACHTAFTSCVSGGTAQDTCFATEQTCIKAAFDAAFQAACDAANNAPPQCQQGVDGMPSTADGGSACSSS